MPNSPESRTPQRPASQGHGPATARPVEKAKDFSGTLKRLIHYLNEYRLQVAAIVMFVLFSTVLSIVSPKMLGSITNQVTDDYMAMKIYDVIHNQLPQGTKLPDGMKLRELVESATASRSASRHC